METAMAFQETVYRHFDEQGRDLPWRQPEPGGHFDPYEILVSELMLQQTQVGRVIPKYEAFLKTFPTIRALAKAPLSAVLTAWSGLGYNRRAKYLHEAARQLVAQPAWGLADLMACKGIGYNTAAAVMVYAHNRPLPFIETNVRTVYIHHFFADQTNVADKELQPIVEATFGKSHPREFCWALMDYGSYLKRSVGNASRYSRHYTRQPSFEGSLRQVRGQILKQLVRGGLSRADLQNIIPDDRLPDALTALENEGLIKSRSSRFYLP